MTKLTKHEKKALAVVLSAGYSAYKDNEKDVSDIFLKNMIHHMDLLLVHAIVEH